MNSKNKNIKIILNTVLKIAIASFSIIYIFYALDFKSENITIDESNNEIVNFNVHEIYNFGLHAFETNDFSWVYVFSILFLMFVNWGIEVVKWKYVISKITPVDWKLATMSILSGVSMAVITPYRLGAFLGKAFQLPFKVRVKSIILTAIINYSQLLITLVCGSLSLLGLILFTDFEEYLNMRWLLVWGMGLVSVLSLILVFIYIYIHIFSHLLERIKFLKKWERHWKVISILKNQRITIRLLGWSFLRYLVFVLQYILAVYLFGWNLNFGMLFLITASLFYVYQFLPTVNALEFGLTKSTIFITLLQLFLFFGPITKQAALVVTCVGFLIWLINIVLPALVGSLFILRVKIFKER